MGEKKMAEFETDGLSHNQKLKQKLVLKPKPTNIKAKPE